MQFEGIDRSSGDSGSDHAPSDLEHRQPQQPERPLGGGRPIVVAQVHRRPRFLQPVVEVFLMGGRHPRSNELDPVLQPVANRTLLTVEDRRQHDIGNLGQGHAVDVVATDHHRPAILQVSIEIAGSARADGPNVVEIARCRARSLDRHAQPGKHVHQAARRR